MGRVIGGKPSRGTPADGRLAANRTGSTSPDTADDTDTDDGAGYSAPDTGGVDEFYDTFMPWAY